ncbi:MAG TPA: low molecular weight protein-tyrosine-phosphatase [Polyangiaceae bacterium]|nr:low molecular weight protein-tyrosine-phosphatase [Polyangiaceae bacterium]
MIRLCFVCLGNICRSPTAEGIMLHLVRAEGLHEHFQIESAGTGAYHVGERPDPRSLATAKARGVPLPSRARQFVKSDFERFDHVLAMDDNNRVALLRLTADARHHDKVQLLRRFDPRTPSGANVPDPYYGEGDGFEHVFDVCEAACRGLLAELRKQLP